MPGARFSRVIVGLVAGVLVLSMLLGALPSSGL